jgi:DNA (cytosine-5)-methyltransferase 1
VRALDLYCGAGGATRGLQRAGFHVTGVDLKPQPNYCGDAFIQGDALAAAVDGFDLIWASPPCQAHTTMSNRWRGKGGKADSHAPLIVATRGVLIGSGAPYVIENVTGARAELRAPIVLTGEMFGLGVHRPRLFETSWPLLVPEKPTPSPTTVGVYGKAHDGRLLWRRKDGTEQRAARTLAEARTAMGIDWMEWRELAEAIPPAYSNFIARSFLAQRRAA